MSNTIRCYVCRAPVLPISALKGNNTELILDAALEVYKKWNTYVKTSTLNRWIKEIQRVRPMPGGGKIKYCTQVSSRPPTFVLFTNKNPKTIPTHYVRFLSTLFKEEFSKMTGIPIRINIKEDRGKAFKQIQRANYNSRIYLNNDRRFS